MHLGEIRSFSVHQILVFCYYIDQTKTDYLPGVYLTTTEHPGCLRLNGCASSGPRQGVHRIVGSGSNCRLPLRVFMSVDLFEFTIIPATNPNPFDGD